MQQELSNAPGAAENKAIRCTLKDQIVYRQYTGEEDLPTVMQLVDNELSEPYSIFTYRFFVQNWPQLCWLAYDGDKCFAVVVCKQENHRELARGYVGMLVVLPEYRGLGVGTELVRRCIQQMRDDKADEVVLECEVTNTGALALYQNLGFIRDKRLVRYYLSGNDAFRLKLMLPLHPERIEELQIQEQAQQSSQGLQSMPGDVSSPHEHASRLADQPGTIETSARSPQQDLGSQNLGLGDLLVDGNVNEESHDGRYVSDLERGAPLKDAKNFVSNFENLTVSPDASETPSRGKGLGEGLPTSKKRGKHGARKK